MWLIPIETGKYNIWKADAYCQMHGLGKARRFSVLDIAGTHGATDGIMELANIKSGPGYR